MNFLNGQTIGMGIGGVIVGALLYAAAGTQVDSLKQNVTSRFEMIDTKLQSLDTKTGTLDVVAGKLTELEKSLSSKASELKTVSSDQISGVESRIKDLDAKIAKLTASQKVAGTVLEKSLSSRVRELKTASSTQISSVESRIKELEAKLTASQQAAETKIAAMKALVQKTHSKAQLAKNASSSTAKDSGNVGGVRLAIAQSGWLVEHKLNVALSYIYPGEDMVRIGLGDEMMDLTKGAPEEFMFEGRRCNVLFNGLTGDKAFITHTCSS